MRKVWKLIHWEVILNGDLENVLVKEYMNMKNGKRKTTYEKM